MLKTKLCGKPCSGHLGLTIPYNLCDMSLAVVESVTDYPPGEVR
jgi:hypothetical protein